MKKNKAVLGYRSRDAYFILLLLFLIDFIVIEEGREKETDLLFYLFVQ